MVELDWEIVEGQNCMLVSRVELDTRIIKEITKNN
jgi:hypothetical protein